MVGVASFFDRVVADTGLSPVFAAKAVARACRRAGVEPEELSPRSLSRVVPALALVMRTFLGPAETEARLKIILKLAE